jgi:hypothetical protein
MDPIPYQIPESLRPGNSAVIPPELLVPPPRRVVTKPEPVSVVTVGVFWAVTVVAVAWLACLAAEPILIWSSPTVSATRIDQWSDGPQQWIKFRYTIGGRTFTESEQVDRETYRAVAGGSALVARVVPILGARLDDLWEPYAQSRLTVWWLTAPVELGLMIYLIFGDQTPWAIRRERGLQTRLASLGTPAVARVISVARSFRLTRSSTPGVFYWYEVGDGIRLHRAVPAMPDVKVGDELVIVYDPARPKVHRLYDLMIFAAAGPD